MIITVLLIALFLSFLGHLFALVSYVTTKSDRSLKTFINTTLSNIILAGTCIVVIMSRPEVLRYVDIKRLTWIMSGVVMVVCLIVKVKIFIKIYKRAKNPDNYHVNFFGKKVLHSSVVSKVDMAIFFGTIPFFLLSGSYFVARFLNFFFTGIFEFLNWWRYIGLNHL
jgi:hypothetical protein